MTQSLVLIGLFIGALACLPWLIARIKQHYGTGSFGSVEPTRVVSAVAIGPTQRVVTVEVGPESARTWLVLGVTQQSVSCLHTLSAPPPAPQSVRVANATAAAQDQGLQ